MGLYDERIGHSAKECMEEGIPDENGVYYFIGTINRTIYSSPSFKDPNMYFNICEFETDSPLPKLALNAYTKKTTGIVCGDTIELIPMKSYKFKAKLELNEKYNNYQYKIVAVFEMENQKYDDLDKYLKFLVTNNQYNLIKAECPDFVEKIFADENFRLPRLKGQRQEAMDNIHRNVLQYRDYVELIATLGQFPEFSLGTITSLGNFDDPTNSKNNKLGNSPAIVLQKIKDDPYVLMQLARFGWKRVDKLALALKPTMINSESRLISFCKNALEDIANASDGGHTWIFINNPVDVKHSMAHLIKENIPECQPCVKDYFSQERELTKLLGCGSMFYVDEERIGLAKYFRAEKSILKHLNRVNEGEHLVPKYTLEEAVQRTNDYMSAKAGEPLSLTEEQVDTIKSTLDNDVIILTAHAGAGKSTTIKGIIELWKDKYIACCALAAKAAIRIREATGMDSFTIHRLLNFREGRFLYNEENPLPYDIVIVDECSMINVGLFLSLLRAIKSGGKIVLVFDDAQLPAIGAGSVAKDLLTSNFCIKRLTKIHRQAAKSGIKIDANNIRQQIDVFAVGNDYDASGTLPLHVTHGERNDMHYYNLLNATSIHTQAIMLYKELISGGGIGGDTPLTPEEISIIVPMKSNMINCTDSFNQEIQELLLADEDVEIKSGTYQDKDKTPRTFKLGCRVIRRKNDYEQMVFNGELGTITDISDDRSSFLVTFDDGRIVHFRSVELANFDLAYALTVHSMQGSENKAVIFVMDTRHTILLDSTLFYTAVTRAKDMNFVIFQPNAYLTAYTTDKVLARQTFLPLLINGVINNTEAEESKDSKDESNMLGGDIFD